MNAKTFDPLNLNKASEVLKNAQSWILFTHRKTDGDAAGSASALFEVGIQTGKSVKWFGPDTEAPASYSFLEHTGDYTPHESIFNFNDPNELYVFLDCSNEKRSVMGLDTNAEADVANVLNIDHHEDNTLYGRVNCVDGRASSTSEMLFRVFKTDSKHWSVTKAAAESLYTGIYTDTGGFSFTSTSPLTHRIVAELIEIGVDPGHISDLITQNRTPEGMMLWARALSRVKLFGPEKIFATSWLSMQDFKETHAVASDTEGLPNMLMTLKGVKMAVIVTEIFGGVIRGSFRSREGLPFSAADVARAFGGGGHERAAGATLEGPLDKCLKNLEDTLVKRFNVYVGTSIDK